MDAGRQRLIEVGYHHLYLQEAICLSIPAPQHLNSVEIKPKITHI
jgi:hypothetical protein